MSDNKEKLVKLATEKFGDIRPCGDKKSLSDCFTDDSGELVLWFNTLDNSTHIVSEHNL